MSGAETQVQADLQRLLPLLDAELVRPFQGGEALSVSFLRQLLLLFDARIHGAQFPAKISGGGADFFPRGERHG